MGTQFELVSVIGLQIDIWRIIKKAFEPGKDIVLRPGSNVDQSHSNIVSLQGLLAIQIAEEFPLNDGVGGKTITEEEIPLGLIEEEDDHPIIKQVNRILVKAIRSGA